jgi:UDP-2,3-diacylglucosamine hydrolase
VLFASDVHLSTARPHRVAAFLEFLAGPCHDASALYLLGDVFDEWLGDDDDRDPHPRVLQALAALTGAGVPVYFAFGNHDFLVGTDFAARSGCRLIPQPLRVEVHGTPVVVLHGDQLCTRDEDYQRWRRTFTDPAAQDRFLALPLEARVDQAKALRHRSAELTRLKAEDIMDVTPEEVVASLRRLGARHMVHGHTHRPSAHALELDGAPGVRLVLGDWYEEGRVVRWDANGPQLVDAG